ncbi:MAG: hypothetical protein OEY50_12020 [Nitrospinota bacterium]|nr:hypothetical protein [Nitrospinota bacterium]MDH5677142.1 hypothetical protein [Nitrospinota bacterium]MDH5755978.1 hypothetical protein [Nitrospinota bacterium]
MTERKEPTKSINLSIDLPEDIAAIIEHHAIMRAKDPAEILREVVQKMIDDNARDVVEALKEK